jgi:2,3-bisphosphoglycerate-dependent phosphoglycerate mutase
VSSQLILLRHGESEWNAEDILAGWEDAGLTGRGCAEASRAGCLIREAGILPDVVHTSLLRRAITTAHLALDVADRLWVPVHRS